MSRRQLDIWIWLASCRIPQFLTTCISLCKAAWLSSWHGSFLPQNEWSKREQGRRHNTFYDSLKSCTASFLKYLIDNTGHPYSMWERLIQGVLTRRWKSLGTILKDTTTVSDPALWFVQHSKHHFHTSQSSLEKGEGSKAGASFNLRLNFCLPPRRYPN